MHETTCRYVNGKLIAHRCGLPFGHHEAQDLRFMVSVRGALVEMTLAETASKNLASNVDYTEWLALSKGPHPAGGDSETHKSNSDSLPWLPLKLQESKGEHV